jgi:hypothetical protein
MLTGYTTVVKLPKFAWETSEFFLSFFYILWQASLSWQQLKISLISHYVEMTSLWRQVVDIAFSKKMKYPRVLEIINMLCVKCTSNFTNIEMFQGYFGYMPFWCRWCDVTNYTSHIISSIISTHGNPCFVDLTHNSQSIWFTRKPSVNTVNVNIPVSLDTRPWLTMNKIQSTYWVYIRIWW